MSEATQEDQKAPEGPPTQADPTGTPITLGRIIHVRRRFVGPKGRWHPAIIVEEVDRSYHGGRFRAVEFTAAGPTSPALDLYEIEDGVPNIQNIPEWRWPPRV